MLRNVCNIMKTTETVTVPTGNVATQYTELQLVVERTAEQARAQESHEQSFSSASKKAQLQASHLRRQWIHPIVEAAKLIEVADPALRVLLKASKARGYERVLVVASSLADRVEPHKALFVERGFNATFVDDLRAEVVKLAAALEEKAEHYRRRSAATKALQKEYARGKKLVRYIDRVVTPVWEKTPAKLAEWKTASRFPRSNHEGQGTDVVTPPGQAVTDGNTQPDGRAA